MKVAVFAWRRIPGEKHLPLGVPYNRDPEFPCDGYEPRKPELGDWRDCRGDGHYLCEQCVRLTVGEST